MTSGVVNVLKPPGMTSHDVVAFIRRTFAIKKVGHAGTLDPAAAGVLPVFIGHATRFIEYLADCDKSYRVELTLGFSTDTGDDTGQVIEVREVAMPSYEELVHVLQSFLGTSQQFPPMYSAVKVNGKKLYEYARQGRVVERKAREISIHNISLLEVNGVKLLFDVDCSKGTYIRTLCEDIGKKFDYPAVMSFLLRTRVGQFSVNDAATLEEITEKKAEMILPVDSVLTNMPPYILTNEECTRFINGRQVFHKGLQGMVRVYDKKGTFLGVGQAATPEILSPVKVVPWQKEG